MGDPYAFLTTPLVSVVYDDPQSATPANALSRAGYPLPASAILLGGGLFVLLILIFFLSGLSCSWCRLFDLFSSELWVTREYEDALAVPPAGFDLHAGWVAGARAKAFQVARKGTIFGGTLFWASLVAGFALSGDVIANVVAASSYDETATLPLLSPWAFGANPLPLTLTLQTAPLSPSGTPLTCVFAAPPVLAGQLTQPATAARGWSVADGYGTWPSAGAPTFNASAGDAAGAAAGVTAPPAGAALRGCSFTLSAPLLTPAWPLLGLADTAPVGAFIGALRSSGSPGDAAVADALAAASAGAGGAAAAALHFTLPTGHALLWWSLSLGDASRGGGAAVRVAPAGSVPLPPLSAPLSGAPPRPPAGAASLLSARAHALRLRLLPSEVADGAGAGATPAAPSVARGWRASVRGYGVAGAVGGGGAVAFPTAAAFSETLTLLLDSEDAVLSTRRSARFSPLAVLALVCALIFGALGSGRLLHDAADAACACRAHGERKARAPLWGLLCPSLCKPPPAARLLTGANGAGSIWTSAGAALTQNALRALPAGGDLPPLGGAHAPPPPPPLLAAGRQISARPPSLRFSGGLFGGDGALTPHGEGGRAFDRGASPARAQLQAAAKRVVSLVGFAGRMRPAAGGNGAADAAGGEDAATAGAAAAAAAAPAAAAVSSPPAEAPATHYKAAPVLGGWRGEEAPAVRGHQSWLSQTQVPLHNGARPF